MNICDHKHPLIAYGERNCPLCDALNTIATHEESIKECENKIYELSTELERLTSAYEPESLL